MTKPELVFETPRIRIYETSAGDFIEQRPREASAFHPIRKSFLGTPLEDALYKALEQHLIEGLTEGADIEILNAERIALPPEVVTNHVELKMVVHHWPEVEDL